MNLGFSTHTYVSWPGVRRRNAVEARLWIVICDVFIGLEMTRGCGRRSSLRNPHDVVKNVLIIWRQLPASKWSGIPYVTIPWSRNTFFICVALAFDVGVALIIFEDLSVITMMRRFSFFLRGTWTATIFALNIRVQTRATVASVVSVSTVRDEARMYHNWLPSDSLRSPCVARRISFVLCGTCAAHIRLR